jgi:hypothetical protein
MPDFAAHALELLRNGHQPVALCPHSKRPRYDGWRKRMMTPDAIARETWHGIGVRGGHCHNGWTLVIMDVDVDDLDDVIGSSVPAANVSKRGARGSTRFYKSRAQIKAAKYRMQDGKPIVELLQTGQSVLPPTIHPDTGKTYRWLEGSLFDTPIENLVEITEVDIEALAKALEPWCPRKAYTPAPTIERELVNDRRMAAYARSCIRTAATRLSSLSDGRHNALFCAASGLGRYVHHGIVAKTELRDALLAACRSNGLEAKRGLKACDACIDRGLEYSVDDQLDDLDKRPGAKPRRPSRWDDYLQMAAQTR